jgi:hypothetical protein
VRTANARSAANLVDKEKFDVSNPVTRLAKR